MTRIVLVLGSIAALSTLWLLGSLAWLVARKAIARRDRAYAEYLAHRRQQIERIDRIAARVRFADPANQESQP